MPSEAPVTVPCSKPHLWSVASDHLGSILPPPPPKRVALGSPFTNITQSSMYFLGLTHCGAESGLRAPQPRRARLWGAVRTPLSTGTPGRGLTAAWTPSHLHRPGPLLASPSVSSVCPLCPRPLPTVTVATLNSSSLSHRFLTKEPGDGCQGDPCLPPVALSLGGIPSPYVCLSCLLLHVLNAGVRFQGECTACEGSLPLRVPRSRVDSMSFISASLNE